MKIFCWLGLHGWIDGDWSSRNCTHCGHIEIRMYSKESGTYWERVT